MLNIVTPLFIYVFYIVITAIQRLWTFEITYNYDTKGNTDFINGKHYLNGVMSWFSKMFLIDMNGRKHVLISKSNYNKDLDENQIESIINLKKPILITIMIFSFLIFAIICVIPYSIKTSTVTENPILNSLKLITTLYIIYLVMCLLYNIIEYFSYKMYVVKLALENYSQTLNPNASPKGLERLTYVFNVWMGKELPSQNIHEVYNGALEKYMLYVKNTDSFDKNIWHVFEYLSSHKLGLIKLVYFLMFSIIVSQSFKIMKLVLPPMQEQEQSETGDDNGIPAKKLVFHVIGRVLLMAVGSLSIVTTYFFLLWIMYIGSQVAVNVFLKSKVSTYKSEAHEHDFDSKTQTWEKNRDHSVHRQWINMLFLFFKREYPSTATQGVTFEHKGQTYTDDKKTLVKSDVEMLTSMNIKDMFVNVFLKKVSIPITILYIISFLVVVTFVIWYESNPVRHKQKKEYTQKEIEDGVSFEGQEVTDRTVRYTYLYQCCTIIMGFILGAFIVYRITLNDDAFLSMTTGSKLFKQLVAIVIILMLISILTFFLFY